MSPCRSRADGRERPLANSATDLDNNEPLPRVLNRAACSPARLMSCQFPVTGLFGLKAATGQERALLVNLTRRSPRMEAAV
jgi:hypothetical protein